MTAIKDVLTVKDSDTFTLNEADLTGKKQSEFLYTTKRDIPRSDGLQWWSAWCPAGDRDTAKGYVSVFLHVNKPAKTKYTFTVDGSLISYTTTYEFLDSEGFGWSQFASHKKLRPLFRDGKLNITCSVEFDVKVPFTSFVPHVFQLFDHIPTDMELIVGSERMPCHKNFISMISPVFHAMFSHDTAESNSSQVEITDFDYETVKAAVDLCYGRQLENPSIDTIVAILRFADKYIITAVTNGFERLPLANLSVETFCTVAHYAYDCNKDALLAECSKFFKNHQAEIKETEKFVKLPLAFVVDVIKAAFDLKTDFDVLRHAHKNGIAFVVEHLEQQYLTRITVKNFCTVVDYAWECSRDELKNRCAKFFNDNTMEVMNLKDFHNLPAETVRQVLEVSYTLKHGTN
uniref:BTB domain-containing protein n=1 Tax=Panagrellus redivivus TaxID=6233 RepID=A0A7E4V4N0_PANRE